LLEIVSGDSLMRDYIICSWGIIGRNMFFNTPIISILLGIPCKKDRYHKLLKFNRYINRITTLVILKPLGKLKIFIASPQFKLNALNQYVLQPLPL